MKETEKIKEYSDRVMVIVNKIRLLGEGLSKKRVVEKIILTLPERFESNISSLEDLRDPFEISLPELVNALCCLNTQSINRSRIEVHLS